MATPIPLDHEPELELSSLPSPRLTRTGASHGIFPSFLPTAADAERYSSRSTPSYLLDRDRLITSSSAAAAASYLFYDSDHELDRARRLPGRPPRPSQHRTNTDTVGGGSGVGVLLSNWYDHMKTTHFPLLRSSPAVGTSSYGALPTSYQGSGASSETPSDEDHGASKDEGPPSSATDGLVVGGGTRSRKRKGIRPGGKARVGLDGYRSDPGDVGSEPEAAVDIDDEEEEEEEDENDPADNSPYPEVRASVLATDDESLSINTPRMWTLSLLFTLVGSSTNLFFSLRYPSISITPVIALLLAHPLGKLWDQSFPDDFEDDEAKPTGMLGRLRRWLAQGRWNRKEHACVYISSNISFGFAFATDVRPLCLDCQDSKRRQGRLD